MSLTWSVPAETKPAPRPLLLVQAFVNTWDGDLRTDALLHPPPARDWLASASLWTGPGAPDGGDLHRARNVRESLRALLVANGGGPAPTPDDLEPLQALAQAAPLRMEIQPGARIDLGPEPGGFESQLAKLLLLVRDAQQDGTWRRLKACRNPDCQWAFYDQSHSQKGAWCDMAVCGNRIKNRRLRQRHG
ncbi:MAG: CGNR zinc finger domain-containing protein [Streptosporangiaceae bacterium]